MPHSLFKSVWTDSICRNAGGGNELGTGCSDSGNEQLVTSFSAQRVQTFPK